MALFRPSADKALRASALGVAVCGMTLMAAPMIYVRTPFAQGRGRAVDQPVLFDHGQHARGAGLDCRYCHAVAERSPRAGMPSVQLCMGCHAQVLTRSPLLASVRRSFAAREPVAWNRVERLPGYVYFHHGIHVRAGLRCQECHGRVEDGYVAAQAAPLTMAWCLDCHWNPGSRGVSASPGFRSARLTTCTACHR